MKKIWYCLGLLLMAIGSYAQNNSIAAGVKKAQLPVIYLPADVSAHFISPEPIQYVDISTNHIIGDLPLKNVLRIKQVADTAMGRHVLPGDDAVVTIAGENFIAQYRVVFADVITARDARTDIEILPADCHPLDITGIGLSQPELQRITLGLMAEKTGKGLIRVNAYGMKAVLNHIFSLGDYVFIDLSYHNSTRLKYDIDQFRFNINDKKVTKATNVQSLEITPVFSFSHSPAFSKNYRNIFAFKKVIIPGNKVLHIELNEKQVSGRVIGLDIPYKDLLAADVLPN